MKRVLKKSIVAMMIVALLFCSVELSDLGAGLTMTAEAATAESGTCGENLTWTFKDGVLTIEGTGDMYDYDDSSNPSPFRVGTDITSVIIGDGVTSIGDYAFRSCKNLTSIELPEGVTRIGSGAFSYCSSLTNVELPEGVTRIGSNAFYYCSSLTSIELPEGVTNIDSCVFFHCSSLTNIELPEGVTRIGNYAFSDCSSLKGIELPEGVTSIGGYAFSDCSSLTSIEIPKSVTSIATSAFRRSSNVVIHGYKGSYAETYAQDDNIPFVPICTHDDSSHVNENATEATCTSDGYTAGVYCKECEAWISGHEVVEATGHTYKTTTTKATTSKNGSVVTKCSVCGDVKSKTTIYYPKTVTLSATSYTYNGKVKKPTVTVKNSNGKTISLSNYTVTYASGCKNVGTYKVTIKFKGNYSGTITKTFKINPATTSISKLSAKSKGFTVKWTKKTTQVTGYQIQYSTSSSFSNAKTVTVSKNSTTSKTISKLTKNKKYYVRIRTYKTVNGTKYYSSWSSKKNIKTK